jgi:flagellar L-ring protein precursor FlgH
MDREYLRNQNRSTHNQTSKHLGKDDQFSMYRKKNNIPRSDIQNDLPPQIKRIYKEQKIAQDRGNRKELLDEDNHESLWYGNGKMGDLYSSDNVKKQGDIVVINVMEKLKTDMMKAIQREMDRRKKIVQMRNPNKKSSLPGASDKTTNDPKENSENKPNDPTDPDKVLDRISSVVVEEINRDHVLLKGRKSLLFEEVPRMIEIQALANKKDINIDDSISSEKILETSMRVL